jgi:hypothetical protein
VLFFFVVVVVEFPSPYRDYNYHNLLPLSLLKGRPPVFHRTTEGDRQERRWNPWVFGHSPVLEAGLAHDKL